jgi:Lon protease-like protein
MLPASIPIFPLPNVVLFPGVFLPLHIFEPRYREMVSDAAAGDRVIGISLLRPGWEADYAGRPAIYDTGCAGVLTHVEPLDDGRYNIVLKGLQKFRVLSESHDRRYRLAAVEPLTEPVGEVDRQVLKDGRHQLEVQLAPLLERADRRLPSNLSDEEVVNALSQYLELELVERQALLECDSPVSRCSLLLELLQMKAMTARHAAGPTSVH